MRARARELRDRADLCRRPGITLSIKRDREKMLKQAQDLEAEACQLEAEADALERAHPDIQIYSATRPRIFETAPGCDPAEWSEADALRLPTSGPRG